MCSGGPSVLQRLVSVGDVSLGIDDHEVHKESGRGEAVSVLTEQRHMSVSCVGAQRGCSQ